jgi:hypothetical protein
MERVVEKAEERGDEKGDVGTLEFECRGLEGV